LCHMPKGLRKIEVSFEEPRLMHFAGMCLIQWFCQKLGLRRLLQRHLRPGPRCREYHPADMILAILYAIIAGMDRVNETQVLQYNLVDELRSAKARRRHLRTPGEVVPTEAGCPPGEKLRLREC